MEERLGAKGSSRLTLPTLHTVPVCIVGASQNAQTGAADCASSKRPGNLKDALLQVTAWRAPPPLSPRTLGTVLEGPCGHHIRRGTLTLRQPKWWSARPASWRPLSTNPDTANRAEDDRQSVASGALAPPSVNRDPLGARSGSAHAPSKSRTPTARSPLRAARHRRRCDK